MNSQGERGRKFGVYFLHLDAIFIRGKTNLIEDLHLRGGLKKGLSYFHSLSLCSGLLIEK